MGLQRREGPTASTTLIIVARERKEKEKGKGDGFSAREPKSRGGYYVIYGWKKKWQDQSKTSPTFMQEGKKEKEGQEIVRILYPAVRGEKKEVLLPLDAPSRGGT